MGIMDEYVNNSPEKKAELINMVDEALLSGSKREAKGKRQFIRDVTKAVKSSIPPAVLGDLSSEINNLVKVCVMTGASNEREFKLEYFDCKLCGNCCRESFPILVSPEEVDLIVSNYGKSELENIVRAHINDIWNNLPNEVKMEIESGRSLPLFNYYKFKKTRPCKYLDNATNKCIIYDSRPKECRNFPNLPEEAKDIDYNVHYFCLGEFEFYVRKTLTIIKIINETGVEINNGDND